MAKYVNQQNSDADKQVIFRFPKGIDQVSAETALPPGAARRIVNLDVHQGATSQNGLTGGRLSHRSKVKLAVAGTRTHSLWSGVRPPSTCYVSAGDLKLLDDNLVATTLQAGVGDAEMFYAETAGNVYLSNGTFTGMITDGVLDTWGLPVPAAPVLAATAFGGLPAGRYMVAYTYRDGLGEESGASIVSLIDVPADGGIALTNIQNTSSYATRVYVSPANGDVLYWAHDTHLGQTTSYVGTHQPGKVLSTQFMVSPSGWTHLENYKGRVYGAVGNALVATQALNYGLTRPATDYILFASDITMIRAVNTGIYVGTPHEVTYLDGGDLKSFKSNPADALPPIPGSGMAVDGALFNASPASVIWLTQRGWVLGSDGGTVKRLTEAQMALPGYTSAAGLYREHDGMRQLLTFVKGGDVASDAVDSYVPESLRMAFVKGDGEAAGASDAYTTEIVRNGVVI